MRDPILITGCARSGTSMTAGIIARCGAIGGDMFGPNRHNPRGMYENRIVREGVVKPYLRTLNVDPMGQRPLPEIDSVFESVKDETFVKKMRETVQCTFRAQGVGEDEPWFYKGAKLCLMWPLWKAMFPKAKWVLVRRSDPAIINSCLRTSFMRAYRTAEGWAGWISEHKVRFREMKVEEGLELYEIWPEKLFSGDGGESFRVLIQQLGLSWNEEGVKEFADRSLWERDNK